MGAVRPRACRAVLALAAGLPPAWAAGAASAASGAAARRPFRARLGAALVETSANTTTLIPMDTPDPDFRVGDPVQEMFAGGGRVEFDGVRIAGVRASGRLYSSDGSLAFEGDFQGGHPWKGMSLTYHSSGRPDFIGNIDNGEKHGIGTQFWDNGQMEFVGRFEHGDRVWGKSFASDGTPLFEGTFQRNAMWDGAVTEHSANRKPKFIGSVHNGRRHGAATLFYDNGNPEFVGQYVHGDMSAGTSYLQDRRFSFKGTFRNGLPWIGEVVHYYPKGGRAFSGTMRRGAQLMTGTRYDTSGKPDFSGELVNSKPAHGTLYDSKHRVVFEGAFLDGQAWSGRRKEYDTGDDYEGPWEHGLRHGNGTLISRNSGSRFVGRFEYGRQLEGTSFDGNDQIIFEGRFQNGQFWEGRRTEYTPAPANTRKKSGPLWQGRYHGLVSEYGANGHLTFQGHYALGQRSGFGSEYNAEGEILRAGDWEGNTFVGTAT